jgi:hypothetical protein
MIDLEFQEREALIDLAQRERRDPRDQAALLLREKLIERGVLPKDTPVTSIQVPAVSHGD